MNDLRGKTVLVTGASRGIGASIAEACAENGARVLVHFSASRAKAEETARRIGAPESDLVEMDLSEDGAGGRLWKNALARAARIDALVNNAGIYERASIDAPDDVWRIAWRRMLTINLQAAADLCRAAIPHFRANHGGAIVNIASRAGHRGDDPDYMHYAASKGALLALTKTIARGYASENILCYAIAPGWVETDMALQVPAARAAALARIPLGRMAAAAEIGALVAFLLSGACASATGATFDVNGASYVRP